MTLIGIFSGAIAGEYFSKTLISHNKKLGPSISGALHGSVYSGCQLTMPLGFFLRMAPRQFQVRQDRYVEVLQPGVGHRARVPRRQDMPKNSTAALPP